MCIEGRRLQPPPDLSLEWLSGSPECVSSHAKQGWSEVAPFDFFVQGIGPIPHSMAFFPGFEPVLSTIFQAAPQKHNVELRFQEPRCFPFSFMAAMWCWDTHDLDCSPS
jgi:hypothetical protein